MVLLSLNMQLTERFKSFVAENGLFCPTDRILLAVSGGKDSVLMTHLFAQAGFNFAIAHCNFKLRGLESEKDEALVAELADTYQVPFYSKAFQTEQVASERAISTQMAARELRYAWFEEIREAGGFAYIALAHHQNDVVETVLLNLLRGTGLAGLHGILAKRDRLIRPLLFLKGNDIADAVRFFQLSYRDDMTNFSNKYARNKLRLDVIPVLKTMNPSLEETFMANSRRFEGLEKIVVKYMDELRQTMLQKVGIGVYEIELGALRALKPDLFLLFELLKPFGFTESVLADVLTALDAIPGKQFYSKTHQLFLDRGKWIIQPKDSVQWDEVLILGINEHTFWGDYSFVFEETWSGQFPDTADKIVLDADKVQFPVHVRSWKQGDTFRPIGMNGTKKLSDLFISLKIPVAEKQRIPVLVNANGEIIWVAPYRMDDRFKITGVTKKMFTLERSLIHGK
ncbi:tRNA(Ile)-lysidine synthase [bacterium A37T11]|nr:tRNA(Ile)-lysidine synthase [bacterium A37T11]